MPTLKTIAKYFHNHTGQEYLHDLYGCQVCDLGVQQERYKTVLEYFNRQFPHTRDLEVFSSPGRVEISGNHTDHENGRVIAGTVHLDTIGIATRNNKDVIQIFSDGYDPMLIRFESVDVTPEEYHTSSALVRGICMYFLQSGYEIGGFDVALTSNVPQGVGLSSSAAFEIFIAQIMNQLFNQGDIDRIFLARAGQYAESEYFRKPCGLMDQMIISFGGINSIDFDHPENPIIKQITSDLYSDEYFLVITNTGGNHVDFTEEYASITAENRAVANFLGASTLRSVDETRFMVSTKELRKRVGDRAILRAVHFFEENKRVLEQSVALENGEFDKFLKMVEESGQSSWTLLQNCYRCTNPAYQGIPLGLMLSKRLLKGAGASRVNGGGFAGTIEAFVPKDLFNDYKYGMDDVFGSGSCFRVTIRQKGAIRLPIPE